VTLLEVVARDEVLIELAVIGEVLVKDDVPTEPLACVCNDRTLNVVSR